MTATVLTKLCARVSRSSRRGTCPMESRTSAAKIARTGGKIGKRPRKYVRTNPKSSSARRCCTSQRTVGGEAFCATCDHEIPTLQRTLLLCTMKECSFLRIVSERTVSGSERQLLNTRRSPPGPELQFCQRDSQSLLLNSACRSIPLRLA